MVELTREEMLRIDMLLHENSGKKTEKINLFLGEEICVEGEPGANVNMVVVGAPDYDKISFHMLSTILAEEECSLIIDDKQGDLYEETAAFLKMKGYSVFKMDFCNFKGNMSYNIFDNASSKEDVMRIADALISSQGDKGDRAWEMSAKELFCMLVQAGRVEYGKHFDLERFIEVFDLCSNYPAESAEENDDFEELMDSHLWQGLLYDAQEDYIKLKTSSDKSWPCILKFLREKLQKYRLGELYGITRETTVPFPSCGVAKTAIFVVGSDADSSVRPITQLFYRDMAESLIKYADERWEGLLPIHVRFLIDGCSGGVQQIGLANVIADNYSQNISCMLSFQSMSQFSALGGEYYKVFYGVTDDKDTVCLIHPGQPPCYTKPVQIVDMPEYTVLQAIRER